MSSSCIGVRAAGPGPAAVPLGPEPCSSVGGGGSGGSGILRAALGRMYGHCLRMLLATGPSIPHLSCISSLCLLMS
eukprot:12901978-Prorocentrum_lima.AAC.1